MFGKKKKKEEKRDRENKTIMFLGLTQSSLAAATENHTYLHHTCFSFLRLHAAMVSVWIKGYFG